ncbi:TIGR02444 family protein [Arenibaculum pallidiluteum]|uniref:TIGR02444 family protein n=1 Tax=Arenibaculum pallidiluteum TaxID=2812559 RepID=UPI001A96DA73|nr:TIGR02444 family protein [Arenibaculum pallidiluteum]
MQQQPADAHAEGGNQLWRHVLELYARPGVAAACLELQDRRGMDVCLLLYAQWAGMACGHRLSEAEAAALRTAVAPWHGEIVRALRAVRKRLKTGPAPAPDASTAALRARVQAVEIDAERIELAALATALPLAPAPVPKAVGMAAALANLSLLCPPEGPEDERALAVLAGT